MWDLNQFATGGLKADMTFIFDLDPRTAQQRIGDQKDRMESRGIEYFEKLRQGFIAEANRFPVGVELIDADGTEDEVWQRVLAVANPLLQKKVSNSG